MNRCKGCGREFRKGTIAFLLTDKGLRGARICQDCASGGVLIVAPKLGPVVQKKVVRSDAVKEVMRMLRSYAAAARNGVKSLQEEFESKREDATPNWLEHQRAQLSHFGGRAEGIESALAALESVSR